VRQPPSLDQVHAPPHEVADVAEPPPESPGPPKRSKVAAAVALIRVGHWTKSAFVLAPLFFSKKLGVGDAVIDALAATAAFSFVASAVYVLNDWTDRHMDARHPVKSVRPFASGELGGRDGVVIGLTCLLIAAAIGLAAGLPPEFWLVIAAYVVINAAYSLWLRHATLVDICVVAAGFVLRVLAGTTAIEVEASSWIVLSTGLLALVLGLGKRRTDLAQEQATDRRSLDGYTVEFIDIALATLAAAVIGFYSLFTVSRYATDRFDSDELYLTTFFVAVGILRYLQIIIAHGRLGSPTDIALRDRPMQLIVAGWALTFYLLSYVL
jgi:decaprenyl-phosphate phosphoribosyltransferase